MARTLDMSKLPPLTPEVAEQLAAFLPKAAEEPAAAAEAGADPTADPTSFSASASASSTVRDPARDAEAQSAYGRYKTTTEEHATALKSASEAQGKADELKAIAAPLEAAAANEHQQMAQEARAKMGEADKKHREAVEISQLRREQVLGKIDLMEATANKIAAVDYQPMWAQTNPLGRALSALGAGVGAFAGNMDGSGENVFVKTFTQGLERDIAMQKLRMQKAGDDFNNQNLLINQFVKAGASIDEAAELAHISALNAGIRRIDFLAKSITNKDVLANIAANQAALQQETATKMMELTKNYQGAAVRDAHGVAALAAQLARDGVAANRAQAAASQGPKAPVLRNDPMVQVTKAMTGFSGDPGASRAQQNLANIDSAKELVKPFKGREDEMSAKQVELFVQEVAQIASKGGTGDAGSREELRPETIQAEISKIRSKYENKPGPAQLGAFVRQYAKYLDDLQGAHTKTVNKYQRQKYDGYQHLLSPEQRAAVQSRYPGAFQDAKEKK